MPAPLLRGTTVVEWADGLSPAYGGRILSDLGAEVIKVERPRTGDPLRHDGPFGPGAPYAGDSAIFGYVNAGKRSITLDPETPTGVELLRRLIDESDVLLDSRPASDPAAPWLDGGALRGSNPRLVRLSVTPHGRTGPRRDRASSDLVVQHVTTDAQWQGLCRAMRRADLAADPLHGDGPARLRRKAELDRELAHWLGGRAAADAETLLQREGVPAARSRNVADVVTDPQFVERGLFPELPDGSRTTALPWMDAEGWRGRFTPAPALGADNDYVLRELLRLGPGDISELTRAGVIR